jgi:glycosyltransferase involved in cell wall biosynthesis
MVTIWCITFNHESYIAKTLDSILQQNTSFPFEIIVHDDCSTDGTREIVKAYASKYPDIIKLILQTENQYSKGVNIPQKYLISQTRGKYIATCEGDDYWCSTNKLQLQVEALEKNEKCSICFHKTGLVNADGTERGQAYVDLHLQTGIITSQNLVKMQLRRHSFHYSSFFIRTECARNFYKNMPEYVKVYGAGDFMQILYYGTQGDAYFINEVMSMYRVGTPGSATNRENMKNQADQNQKKQKLIESIRLYNEFTEYQYDAACRFRIEKMNFEIKNNEYPYREVFKRKNRHIIQTYGKKYIIKMILRGLFPRAVDWFMTWHYMKRDNIENQRIKTAR